MVTIYPEFDQVVRDIKSLHIQGAQRIAKEGFAAFKHVALQGAHDLAHLSDYARLLKKAKDALIQARSTEPLLRNVLRIVFNDKEILKYHTIIELHEHIQKKAKIVEQHFEQVHKMIPRIGAHKIKDGFTVYTHCHSSNVVNAILEANAKGKTLRVCNTETRPKFQGRITAKELALHQIPVEHFVDSAMRLAIKKCDIVLIGCDAIDTTGRVYNKIGSELVCETAHKYQKPVYIVTDSWKFDPEHENEPIEMREASEVWEDAPEGVTISNYAFERINPELITGIISEFGIHTIPEFLKEVRERYDF
ncbi:MAG: translation initiation factor eIF-2B [Candidatus Woesearchaeota archaeon]